MPVASQAIYINDVRINKRHLSQYYNVGKTIIYDLCEEVEYMETAAVMDYFCTVFHVRYYEKIKHYTSAQQDIIKDRLKVDVSRETSVANYVREMVNTMPANKSVDTTFEEWDQLIRKIKYTPVHIPPPTVPNQLSQLISRIKSLDNWIKARISTIEDSDAFNRYCASGSTTPYQEMETCTQCNEWGTDMAVHEGIYYCPTCVDRYLRMCDFCQELHLSVTSRWVNGLREPSILPEPYHSKQLCPTCFDLVYEVCELCDKPQLKANMRDVPVWNHNKRICARCLLSSPAKKKCEVPGCTHTFNGLFRHMQSRENRYDIESETNITFQALQSLCDKHISMLEPIQPYWFKPSVRPFYKAVKETVNPNTLYLGFELEFEAEDRYVPKLIAQTIKQKYGHSKYLIQTDGSLTRGAEIVANPFTYQHYRTHKPDLIKLHRFVTSRQGKFNGSNCGFHIHASKSAFTSIQIYRLAKLFSNRPEYLGLEGIFGRGPDTYNQVPIEDAVALTDVAKSKKNRCPDHYLAFNLSNSGTVEFRMFRGPVTPRHMLAYLEAVFAFHAWSQQVSNKHANAASYLRFVRDNKATYFNLYHLAAGKFSKLRRGKK